VKYFGKYSVLKTNEPFIVALYYKLNSLWAVELARK
jgi:hypothetical protein